MSFIKKIAGDTAIYGISSILFKIVNFLFMASYLTRRFPETDDYAIHGVFYAFAAFILVLYTLRMETAFFRFGNDLEYRDTAFSTASMVIFVTAILMSVVLIVFARPIAALITSPEDIRYVIWLVIIIAFDSLAALPFAKMRLDNRPLKFALYKALNTVINIVFTLVFLEALPRIRSFDISTLSETLSIGNAIDWTFIANILASFLIFLILIKEYFKIKFRFDRALLKKMWTYAWPLLIVGVAGVINQFSDRVFLNNLSSPEDSGIYNGAIKIAIIMSLFVSAFNYAAEPFFFNQMRHKDVKEIYAFVAQAFALVASILLIGILLYIDILEYLIGSSYREGLVILPFALLGFLFLGLHYNFSIWYKVRDKTTIGAWIGISGMVVTILGNMLLIPEYGILGSAISLTVCFATMAAGSYFSGRKYYPVPYDMKRIAGYVVGAMTIYLTSLMVNSLLPDNLWINLGMNTILLLIGLILLWILDKANLKKLFSF